MGVCCWKMNAKHTGAAGGAASTPWPQLALRQREEQKTFYIGAR